MEGYLQNLRNLRSQMNDIEEAAAKRSVEEQRQKTAIDDMEKELLLVTSKSTRLNAESEEMEKERTQICYQILEKQKKISSLENETSTLSQSLELLRQQTVSASASREEKRSYFAKVMEDSVIKLQQEHDWLSLYKKQMETSNLVKEHTGKHLNLIGDVTMLRAAASNNTIGEKDLENMRKKMGRRYQDLMRLVESRKNDCEELKVKKYELDEENIKSKQIMLQLKQKTETFTAGLKTLDVEALQEEHKALLADEAGEMEYFKSLEDQIKQVKNVSHAVKCQCGEEYMVKLVG